LGELPRARLDLIEQSDVLDGNHGLVGECGHQLDFLVGERLYTLARESDDTDGHILAQQGYAQYTPSLSELICFGHVVFRVSSYIRDLDNPAFEQSSGGDSPTARGIRQILNERLILGREPTVGRQSIDLSLATENERHLGVAEMRGRLNERVEHGL